MMSCSWKRSPSGGFSAAQLWLPEDFPTPGCIHVPRCHRAAHDGWQTNVLLSLNRTDSEPASWTGQCEELQLRLLCMNHDMMVN